MSQSPYATSPSHGYPQPLASPSASCKQTQRPRSPHASMSSPPSPNHMIRPAQGPYAPPPPSSSHYSTTSQHRRSSICAPIAAAAAVHSTGVGYQNQWASNQQSHHQHHHSHHGSSSSSSVAPSSHRRSRSFRDATSTSRSGGGGGASAHHQYHQYHGSGGGGSWIPPLRYSREDLAEREMLLEEKRSGGGGSGGLSSASSPSASSVLFQKRTRPVNRPPPLKCFEHQQSHVTSSCSSASTATTFFNSSTESSSGGGGGMLYRSNSKKQQQHGGSSTTPGGGTGVGGSTWSMSSEYSTTSSNRGGGVLPQQQDIVQARIAAAGGKLAYLASRRGSSGSVCSTTSTSNMSTPPNTPGKTIFERMGGSKARRQSSGNFLEVPGSSSFAAAVTGAPGGSTVSPSEDPKSPTTPTSPRSPNNSSTTSRGPPPRTLSPNCRPRTGSLPAASLLSPHGPSMHHHHTQSRIQNNLLLSPTYTPHYYQHTPTPYNPRSTITKSQDHLYRLRTFNITKQGDVVNCGDTFVRKSKSNNCIASSSQQPDGGMGRGGYDDMSTSPRKCSLSTSPSKVSPRSSPCRRGSLSPRLVINYPLLDASCCVSRGESSSTNTNGSSEDEEEEEEQQQQQQNRRVPYGREEDDDEDEDDRSDEDEDGGGGGPDEDDDESQYDEEDELTMRELSKMENNNGSPRYRVVMLGDSGVGKSSLVRQFMTSEYINTYDMSLDEEYGEREVSVLLDSFESQLVFIDHPCVEMSVENSLATYEPHACIVVYSVTDKRSFEFAGEVLRYLWQEGTTHERSVILVGNKCDLARVRVISTQEGKQLATSHDTKFIEASSGIQHNVDELLVGVLKQIRLRQEANGGGGGGGAGNNGNYDHVSSSSSSTGAHHNHHHNNNPHHHHHSHHTHHHNHNHHHHQQQSSKKKHHRGGHTPRGSIMSLLFTRELINKLCFLSNKAKSCENLHVL